MVYVCPQKSHKGNLEEDSRIDGSVTMATGTWVFVKMAVKLSKKDKSSRIRLF